MKHSRSSAEWEIRDALVAFLRETRPQARIVHELNVAGQGSSRADLAAVGESELLLFEIKSERDVLKRVESQFYAFQAACHGAYVVAHRKWFEDKVTPNASAIRFLEPNQSLEFLRHQHNLWAYPEPGPEYGFPVGKWRLRSQWERSMRQPHAARFLALLWAAELRAECGRHNVAATSRATMDVMVDLMCWHMSGKEIAEAVCRQLRQREFAEADPPMQGA